MTIIENNRNHRTIIYNLEDYEIQLCLIYCVLHLFTSMHWFIYSFMCIIFMIWHILYSLYMAFIDFQHRLCGRGSHPERRQPIGWRRSGWQPRPQKCVFFYHQYSGGDGCILPRLSPTNHTPHVPFMCHPERSQPRFTSPAWDQINRPAVWINSKNL